jgi:hypothetical protein
LTHALCRCEGNKLDRLARDQKVVCLLGEAQAVYPGTWSGGGEEPCADEYAALLLGAPLHAFAPLRKKVIGGPLGQMARNHAALLPLFRRLAWTSDAFIRKHLDGPYPADPPPSEAPTDAPGGAQGPLTMAAPGPIALAAPGAALRGNIPSPSAGSYEHDGPAGDSLSSDSSDIDAGDCSDGGSPSDWQAETDPSRGNAETSSSDDDDVGHRLHEDAHPRRPRAGLRASHITRGQRRDHPLHHLVDTGSDVYVDLAFGHP